MEFYMKEWRRMYDKVHELGELLRDSQPTYDEHGNYYAPKTDIGKEAQIELEFQIKMWMDRSTRYLNRCGMRPKTPLWCYERMNPETHASSKAFKYGHLMAGVA